MHPTTSHSHEQCDGPNYYKRSNQLVDAVHTNMGVTPSVNNLEHWESSGRTESVFSVRSKATTVTQPRRRCCTARCSWLDIWRQTESPRPASTQPICAPLDNQKPEYYQTRTRPTSVASVIWDAKNSMIKGGRHRQWTVLY